MAGKPAHPRDKAALRDIRTLLARPGVTKAQAAAQLGMSRATLYRILSEARA